MYRLKIWLVIFLFSLSIPAQAMASVGIDSEIPSTELSPAGTPSYYFILGDALLAFKNCEAYYFQYFYLFDSETISALANKDVEDYQLQVIKEDGDWETPLWDSNQTALTYNTVEGDRIPVITYGGTPLVQDGSKYYWRLKIWDDDDNEGPWTNGNDWFQMAGQKLQDLTYTYDDVGNITQIIDVSQTDTKKTANYSYDDLYRLTSAVITDTDTYYGQDYTQNFSYDPLGNITSFPDLGTYEYEGNEGTSYANPHATTGIPALGAVVSYDHNGNATSMDIGAWNLFSASYDYYNRKPPALAGVTKIALSVPFGRKRLQFI